VQQFLLAALIYIIWPDKYYTRKVIITKCQTSERVGNCRSTFGW
jgi:hypothetical protein